MTGRPADRHKDKPKAVRMPGGLLAWYKQEAPARSVSVNALIVAALQEYRARHGGDDTAGAPRDR